MADQLLSVDDFAAKIKAKADRMLGK